MNPILKRIKRCIINDRVRFTFKAGLEMARDGLSKREVLESIFNANEISKIIRSRAIEKSVRREYLYIIESFSYDRNLIYTKGKLTQKGEEVWFYVLISAKLSREE